MMLGALPTQHDASTSITGPFLLFRGTQGATNLYSILIVYPPSFVNATPSFYLSHGEVISTIVLDTAFNYTFWRFTFSIPLLQEQQLIQYRIDDLPLHSFCVPAYDQPWCFAFFSCNGLSSDVTMERKLKYNGIQPLWIDVLKDHQRRPLHLLIGGGDQLYFDPLFDVVPGLHAWAQLTNKLERQSASFDMEMERGVAWFYLNHYLHGFMDGAFALALASIPSCMSWDDHDIFDGWGSYPDYLQHSKVFQGIFQSALRFYLLFQHHTTPTLAKSTDGYIGYQGFHKVLECGPSLALVLPDTRTERSLDCIVHPNSWDALFQALTNLPRTLRHVLLLAPIPMIYPPSSATPIVYAAGTSARAVSTAIRSIGNFINDKCNLQASLTCTAVYKSMVNRFGEPELLDDLRDHWNHSCHKQEKIEVLLRFQDYIRTFLAVRVTILSGDVHLAAVGMCYSKEHKHDPINLFAKDPKGMYQIVSSAIANLPPPRLVATGLSHNLSEMHLDAHTNERMLDVFPLGADGHENPTPCFLRRRNWTLGEMDHHELRMWICAEKSKGNLNGETTRYFIRIPDFRS